MRAQLRSRQYSSPVGWYLGLFAAALLALGPAAAWGQNQAALRGTITDPSGAAVAGAQITVTNQATQVARATVSTGTGFYQVGELPPGVYTVAVAAKGFAASQTRDVQVLAEQPRGLNLQLTVGQVSETVTVSASTTPLLQTQNASLSNTLGEQEVTALPKFGRDPYELVRLAPGVFGDGARSGIGQSVGFPNGPGANNGSGGTGGSNSALYQTENQQPVSADGQRITSNDYTIDGVSVNSLQWGGAAVLTPSPASVQEITVVSNDYNAADGRNSGAHIKAVTHGGTDQLHGGGFFQLQDPGLNAYNKYGGFNPGSGFAPDVRVNSAFRQFGGDLGGPIVKGKVFFFFDYEGLHNNSSTSQQQWVDTPAFDQLLIAHAGAGTPVAATLQAAGVAPRVEQVLTPSCVGFATAKCQVVGQGVNVGSPSGAYGTYVDNFSTSAGGGLTGVPEFEYAQLTLPSHTTAAQYNARLDYTSGANTLTANTFVTDFNDTQADGGAQGRPMADLHSHRLSPSGFLSWVDALTPTLVNELRFNFTRWAFNDLTANPQVNWAIPRTEVQGIFPNGQRLRYGAAQAGTTPGIFAENTFALREQLSAVHGNHALEMGAEFDREQNNNNLLGGARPDIVFQGPWDFANGAPIFEATTVNPLTGAPTDAQRYYRDSILGAFLQDNWQLRPNLTVNLGLRWDYFAPPNETRGQLENIVPGPDPVNGLKNARAVLPTGMWSPVYHNFGPRLGFAWSPQRFNNKAVLRGGFGIAFDNFDDVIFDNTNTNPPLVANFGLCCGTAGSPFMNGQLLYGLASRNTPLAFPANPALATTLNPATNLPVGLSPNVWATPTSMPNPYVYEYSLQAQYALASDWVATLGYQGSSSHGLVRIKNLLYFYANPGSQFGAVFQFTPDTNANYNALLAQLQHHFAHGLMADLTYVYSKSIDEVSAEGPGFVTNQTYPTNLATERGPSDFNNTHNVRAYAVWDVPIFGDSSTLLGKTLGGWQLSPVFQFHTGFPWTPVASNHCDLVLGAATICPIRPVGYLGGAGSATGNSAFLPPATPGGSAANFSNGATSYFDVTRSGVPGIGRNSFVGPRFSEIDMSLSKAFGLPDTGILGEKAKLELRANAFNLFNQLNLAPFTFGSPQTTISYFNNGSTPASNPMFGIAGSGLAGRTVELQGQLSF